MFELNSGNVEQSANLDSGYNGSVKKSARVSLLRWDKILLILAIISFLSLLAAFFVLLTPVLNMMFDFMGFRFAGWAEWQAWIMEGERGLFIAVALSLIALVFAFLARYRLIRDYSVYVEAGCPHCHENELIRVRRNRKDRTLSRMGLPVRRYSCRNCTWHGLRLAGYRYKRNKEGDGLLVTGPSDVETIEDQPGIIDESLSQSEVGFEAVTNAEIETYDDNLAFSLEDASANPVAASPGFRQDANDVNNGYVAGPVVEVELEKTSDVAIYDEDSAADQQVEDQLALQTDQRLSDLETDQAEGSAANDAGTEPGSEDDEFARLCREVAQSKK